MACCEKYKALILKYVPYISKYMAYIFCFFQIFEKQRLIKGEKCSLFSCRFSVIFSAFEAFLIAYRRVRLLDGLS